MCASQKGYIDIVRHLVRCGKASVNVRTKEGNTALHQAAYDGKMPVVKYLVENCKSVITVRNVNGRTPIRRAEDRGYPKIADYLKARVMKMVMGIDLTILPFYTGVRSIIAKYLQ